MKSPMSFAASRQHLRCVEDAIERQEAFIRQFAWDDEFRMVAERVMLGLQATIVMLRAQHLLVLEKSVGETTHRPQLPLH